MIEGQQRAEVLLLASGKVTGNTARPARIVFKGEPVPRSGDVVEMLHAFADGVDLRDRTGRRHQVIVKPHHAGVDVSSAVLDHLNAMLGVFIAPVTISRSGACSSSPGRLHATPVWRAWSGGAVWTAESMSVIHMSADVVRFIHSRLLWSFGVPARVTISPHEPETVTHKANLSSSDPEVLKRITASWTAKSILRSTRMQRWDGKRRQRSPYGRREPFSIISTTSSLSTFRHSRTT